jgi:hypothetical protein
MGNAIKLEDAEGMARRYEAVAALLREAVNYDRVYKGHPSAAQSLQDAERVLNGEGVVRGFHKLTGDATFSIQFMGDTTPRFVFEHLGQDRGRS